MTEIETRLGVRRSALGRKRVQLVQNILNDARDTYHLSARQMAKRYSVDPATVTRTVKALGYEAFADFAEALRSHFLQYHSPLDAFSEHHSGPSQTKALLHLFECEIENLKSCAQRLDTEQLGTIAAQVVAARNIVIAGLDLIDIVAQYLHYGLTAIGCAATAPSQRTTLKYSTRAIGPGDVLIAFGFGRTIKESALAAVEARQNGALVIGITDPVEAVISRLANYTLIAPSSGPAISGSLVAAIALSSALINACAEAAPERSVQLLARIHDDYERGDRWFAGDLDQILRTLPA